MQAQINERPPNMTRRQLNGSPRISSMTVEGAKSIFDWGTVILAFLTFAFGAGVLITGNIINKQQAEKQRQFDKDLTSAKEQLVASSTEMAKQQERAATAEKELLELKEKL